jgi:RND family efflux transporter MFP subunit
MTLSKTWTLGSIALIVAAAVAIASASHEAQKPAATMQPVLAVTIAHTKQQLVPERITANGNVVAWQEASIGSEISGVRLEAVYANVGDQVRRGQVLARFAPETLRAQWAQLQATVAEAQAHLAGTSDDAARARSLAETGAMSQQQINQALAAEKAARARLSAQRAAADAQRIQLQRAEVRAPEDGVISARIATQGAVVPPGQELFRLIIRGRLEWRAEVTPEEAAGLETGASAEVQGPRGESIAGRIRMIAPSVDTRTRTALVYVDLPPNKRLRSGMYASGAFDMGMRPGITVAQDAVVMRDGFAYVFRVGINQRVEQVKVELGQRVGNQIEVTRGLEPNAALVATGAGFLNHGDLVRVVTLPAGAVLARLNP